MTFQLGEQVEWLIGARNDPFTCVCHVGEVVGVVAPMQQLFDVKITAPHYHLRLPAHALLAVRDHESYIIHEPGKGRGKGKLYWPRVSALRKVGGRVA